MVNDSVKSFRTEEEIIDFVKNWRLQLEGVIYFERNKGEELAVLIPLTVKY